MSLRRRGGTKEKKNTYCSHPLERRGEKEKKKGDGKKVRVEERKRDHKGKKEDPRTGGGGLVLRNSAKAGKKSFLLFEFTN